MDIKISYEDGSYEPKEKTIKNCHGYEKNEELIEIFKYDENGKMQVIFVLPIFRLISMDITT